MKKKSFRPLAEVLQFNPGDVYVFHENKDRGYHLDSLDFIFCIRSMEEVIPALEMEYGPDGWVQMRQFLGCRKVGKYCYELRILCYDTDELDAKDNGEYSIFLHRIRTLKEVRVERLEKDPLRWHDEIKSPIKEVQ